MKQSQTTMSTTETAETAPTSDVNKVEVQGAIVAKHSSSGMTVLTVATHPTKVGNAPDRRDYARFFFFKNIPEADSFKVGDKVHVIGQIQTSRKYPEQIIAGNFIEFTKRSLEIDFGEESGKYLDDINKVLIRGTLCHTFIPEGKKVAIITLKTNFPNGFSHFPQIACFGKQFVEVQKAKKGSPIIAIGHIQTSKKVIDKETKHFHSVVADYVKL